MSENSSSLPQLPSDQGGSVPVFNCHVILSPVDAQGYRTGRVANLPDIECRGGSEREILLAVTRRFKAVVQQHTTAGEPIPWTDPPVAPRAGESERFVPVHL